MICLKSAKVTINAEAAAKRCSVKKQFPILEPKPFGSTCE